jgi:hypothetical protein
VQGHSGNVDNRGITPNPNRGYVAEVKTLREVAEELGCSYRVAWSAATSGRLPAFQPFGSGTTWVVPANYQDILFKSADGTDGDNNGIMTKAR